MAMGWKLSPKSIAKVLAAMLMALVLAAQPALADAHAAMAADSPREVVDLADGWRFAFGDAGDAASQPDFDDSSWQAVSVPHSWNVIGEYALKRSERTNNAQGIGWYRLTVPASGAARGKRRYLDFGAVGNIADVWVNGRHVGTHKGAFSRFRLDVTDAWKPDETNLIALRADNSKPAIGSSTEHVIPLAGDFFVHGGPYRGVSLISLPSASIDPLDYGGPGLYARAAEVTDERAVVDVRTRLRNFDAGQDVTLNLVVRDAQGRIVAHDDVEVALGSGWQDVRQRVTIANPRRWDGRADPYLYSLTAILRGANGALDSITQPLGVRTFRFDADDGFFLNGKHMKLHGVSRHQDWLDKGWALSRDDHAQDMALMREMGVNSVRHAHYQHDDAWSDEADRAGMVVWAELAYVGAPSLSGGKGSEALWANAEQQLRELIRQNFNHPSIMMWSIGNEVDSAKAFGAVTEDPSPVDLLRHLEKIAKQEDPATPTIFADFSEDFGPFGKSRQQLTGVTDLIAYNRYPGWYYFQGLGAGQVLGGMMDALHAKHPAIPIGISEYGAGSGLSQFSDDPLSGYVAFSDRPQPEEYATLVHEMLWPVIAERDYVFASWAWNMFDFASDLRNEGDSVDINTKGLVSMDRKVKKDAFYFYKAAWTSEPMIHLAGKRYVERSYPVMSVKAYTNADAASLTVNGAEIGEVACPNHTCEWKGVRLQPGKNSVVARAAHGDAEVSDNVDWIGPYPVAQGIRINAGELATRMVGGKRYGSDTFVSGGKAVARYVGSIGGRGGDNIPVEAAMPALYDYWRAGEAFSYSIPVPDGQWRVTIRTVDPGKDEVDPLMAEMMGGKPEEHKPARMSVSAGGIEKIAKLDVAAAAGGERKGLARSFPVTVSGGMLLLEFAGVEGGKAIVAGIEITK